DPRRGAQCSGERRVAMHHGAKNSACKNTPPVKCATRNTSDNASIPALLARFGVSVIFPGVPVMNVLSHCDDKERHQAGRCVRPVQGKETKMNAIVKCPLLT